MKVLLDTNVVLDVLLMRQPWVAHSQLVWAACDEGRIQGHIAAITPPNIFYIVRKLVDAGRARECVKICLEAFGVLNLDQASLRDALNRNGADFEDDIHVACASACGIDAIITRDPRGFAGAPMPIFDPATFLARLPQ